MNNYRPDREVVTLCNQLNVWAQNGCPDRLTNELLTQMSQLFGRIRSDGTLKIFATDRQREVISSLSIAYSMSAQIIREHTVVKDLCLLLAALLFIVNSRMSYLAIMHDTSLSEGERQSRAIQTGAIAAQYAAQIHRICEKYDMDDCQICEAISRSDELPDDLQQQLQKWFKTAN